MDTQAIIKEGELLFNQGRLREAEEQFLAVVKYDLANKEAHNNLGVLAFSAREHEKAIAHFKKAIDIDPLYREAILNLGDVLQATNALTDKKVLDGSDKSVVHNKKKLNVKNSLDHNVCPNDGFLKVVQNKLDTIASGKEDVDPLFWALLLKETFKFGGAQNADILNGLTKILNDTGYLYEAYVLAKKSLEIKETNFALRSIDGIVNKPPLPQCATIEITTYCNLKCPLCDLQKRPEHFRPREHLKLDEFRFIWDRIKQSLKMTILVGDGESFLNPDIYDIIELASRDCPHVYIDTNGSLNMDHDRLVKSGLAELNYSIDGIDQEMYSKYRRKGRYDKAMVNMIKTLAAKKRLNRSTPRVVWKYVVFKHNEAYVQEAAKLAKEIGVDEFRLEPCTYNGADWNELVRFIPVNPKFHRGYFFSKKHSRVLINPNRLIKHCTIPSREIDILINGDVKFCCSLDRSQTIGNIMHGDSFLDIWHSRQAAQLRRKILTNRFDFAPCLFCTMKQDSMASFFWDTEFAEAEDDMVLFDDLFPEEERIYYDDIRIRRAELEALKRDGKEREVAYFEDLDRIQEDGEGLGT